MFCEMLLLFKVYTKERNVSKNNDYQYGNIYTSTSAKRQIFVQSRLTDCRSAAELRREDSLATFAGFLILSA